MVTLFNNCRGRDHVEHYGEGAFFDLDADDRQRHRIAELDVGSECVVASYGDRGTVIFRWFTFTHQKVLSDEDGCPTHVVFGVPLRSEEFSKAVAAATTPYKLLFNRLGHFKRLSLKQVE